MKPICHNYQRIYAFEQYFADFIKTIPTTYEVNSSDFGTDVTSEINKILSDAQNSLTEARNSIDAASRDFGDGLKEARTYVGYFRLGFIGIIALIVLVITGIILICRNVKDSCLDLGIVFFLYGAGEFAGVLIAKNIAGQELTKIDIPQSLSHMPGILLNDVISPLQTISLVCLIGGVLLIITSFVYPRFRTEKTE
jgi:hypothetical protein